ncbi:MAG: hypothetical protein KKC03_04780 [Bacteroidetes bacterium]|nr:hypothetical protein [Bacteroidota bacterium]
MKNIFITQLKYVVLSGIIILSASSCNTEFENPNSPTNQQILNSRDGLFSLAVGIRQLYSTSGLRFIIETPAVTTREGGITTTFLNMIELEEGGTSIPNFNTNTQGLWVTLTRLIGMTEDLSDGAETVDLQAGSISGLKAYANIFKALSIGHLALSFEQVILETSPNNDAVFVPRQQGLLEAIRLLEEAKTLLGSTPPSPEFENVVLGGNLDLVNIANLFLARFNLYAGNFEAAINSANLVSESSLSFFNYDNLNPNPIWARVIQNNVPNFKPQDNFGLPTAIFTFDTNDGRFDFYTSASAEINPNGYAIENLEGFFQTQSTPIPVYIPDEAKLILAEAHLRKSSPDINAAVGALDEVLTDNDDPLGINANVAAYSGPLTVNDVLLEIYKNRRAELFLTGNSLEDSRRFNRPQPNPTPRTFTDERNRNFYPYANTERNNNPNTPPDPAI